MSTRLLWAMVGCVAVTVAVLWTPVIPLGIPGEWEWQRHHVFADVADAIDRLLPVILAGAFLYGTALYGSRRIVQARRIKLVILSVALTVMSGIWLSQLRHTATIEHREARPYWILYDPSSSGYFFEAAFHISSMPEFLAGYEARMREGEVLHVGTHPPGLFLLSRLCLEACEYSPKLVSLLNAVESERVRKAFRLLESTARLAPPLKTNQLAALHLLSLLADLTIVLTVIPLGILSSVLFGRVAAWNICCLWPTVPCIAVFVPGSDVLFPFTCTTMLMLSVLAMRGGLMLVLSVLAGCVLWLGMMLSLAHLPVLVLVGGMILIRAWSGGMAILKRGVLVLTLILATVGLLSVLWTVITDCNLFAVWPLNLKNHAGFYDQFTRTWWKWLLLNPLELAFSVGLPVFLISAIGATRACRNLLANANATSVPNHEVAVQPRPVEPAAVPVCVSACVTLGALWLSGKNQGEAARLWCFLTPWLLLCAGYAMSLMDGRSVELRSGFRWLLIAQMTASILTVSRVSGFMF